MSIEVLKLGEMDDLLDDIDEEEVEQPKKAKKQQNRSGLLQMEMKGNSKLPDTPEDKQKHRDLVLACTRYGANERFSAYLKEAGFRFNNLGDKTIDQLTTMKEQISSALANRNASGIVTHAFFGALTGMERVPKLLRIDNKFDLSGLANMCKNHPDISPAILDDLAEIECNMGDITSMPPEKRLLLNVSLAAMRVAAANAMTKAMLGPGPSAPPAPSAPQERPKRPDNVRKEGKEKKEDVDPRFDFPDE